MRPKILLSVFIIFSLLLVYKLFYWQVIKKDELSTDAQSQYSATQVTVGARGNILASDGSFLAMKYDYWKLTVDNNKLNMPVSEFSKKIADILNKDSSDIENLLNQKKGKIIISQKVDSDAKKNIDAMKLSGINFEKNESRYYPEASSSAQLLGFLGKDENGQNLGYFGLEGYYNLPLNGKTGYKDVKKDAKGSQILAENSIDVSSSDGVDLLTSIDKRVQLLIEQKLKEGVEKYGALGGSVTVMDPTTGNIIAMASYPSFDPSNYQSYNDSLFKNPVISDSFEPGSIFKVIVMAAGLDSGVVKPDTECDICSGPLKLDKYEIKTWNNKYTDMINMTDVIVHSDNVGMAFVGQKMGADNLYDYLSKFGIGQKTGIDLQGEVAPKMREKGTWNIVDLATASFGQGIAVTGIEMLRAVSVIANGGYLVTPRVVNQIQNGGWKQNIKTDPPVRIISQNAAEETALMMVEAVNRGEAKWAKPSGYNNLAGKTGTAQIPVAGHYDAQNTNHSFIGFAPFKNAKFIMLVTLKSPQSSPWAAETAAPLWFNIAKDLFVYFGVAPN